ncbi:uncharacterized protein BYT42DRAFT_628521, partial [Radiomyces spectabilis]|uniref:uncharacterized protein n=1 Tax=Radiomyces spectabilis TaxID=64574 RepID=UPI00221EF09B
NRSKVTQQWRLNHGIQKLDWPALSPDLNSIENIWYSMKLSVPKMCHAGMSDEQHTQAIRDTWESIDYNIINKSVDSMSRGSRQCWR